MPVHAAAMPPAAVLRAALAAARGSALRPPPTLTVDEWADRYRMLSREASSTGGRWRTATVAVARGPMRSVTEPGVREITVMACTQLLKTELLNNILGYRMHLDPGPMLVIQPTEGMAESWSKDRLSPMLRDTPELRELVSGAARSSDSTILHKTIPGGHITMVGANSPAELASRPIRDVYSDEVDKYPASAGAEGDPIGLAEERTATFPASRLLYRSCSPTIRGKSRIERLYHDSDQRKPFLACPHCGVRQVARWGDNATPGGVKWARNADGAHMPETALYYCPHCGSAWSEMQRLDALQAVDWRQCRPFRCCGTDHNPLAAHECNPEAAGIWDWDGHVWRALCSICNRRAVPVAHAGFWASKLYSPWEPVSKLAAKFLSVRQDVQSYKMFVNTSLAETWEEASEQTDGESLLARREAYPCGTHVPDDVVALFSGVDAQRDRLEVQTIGIGRDERLWVIDYRIIQGDASDPGTLDELASVLWTPRTRGDGRQLYPEAVCVDVGDGAGSAAALYRFCADNRESRCWAVRGASARAAPIWSRKPTVSRRHNATFYAVGTQNAKSHLARRLAMKRGPDVEAPPGYIHLNRDVCDPTYIAQLTAEKLVRREAGGQSWHEWQCPQGARNEALDTLVYAWAAYESWLAMNGRISTRAAEQARGAEVAARAVTPPETPAEALTRGDAHSGVTVSSRATPPSAVPAQPAMPPPPSGLTRAPLQQSQKPAAAGWFTPRSRLGGSARSRF